MGFDFFVISYKFGMWLQMHYLYKRSSGRNFAISLPVPSRLTTIQEKVKTNLKLQQVVDLVIRKKQ